MRDLRKLTILCSFKNQKLTPKTPIRIVLLQRLLLYQLIRKLHT